MPIVNNVTRLLDARKVLYTALQLPAEKLGALEVAGILKVDPATVFKTIVVTRDRPKRPLLVLVPATAEVDLKQVASTLGEKKVHLPSEREAEELTGLECRVSILGYVQRGGTPSAADRLLATRLGTACAELVHEGHFGVMVAARGEGVEPVPIGDVAGKRKEVPPDHPWVQSARAVGTCLGD